MDLASENETRVFSAYSKRKREDELVEASKRKSITSRSVDSAGNKRAKNPMVTGNLIESSFYLMLLVLERQL